MDGGQAGSPDRKLAKDRTSLLLKFVPWPSAWRFEEAP